MPVKSSMLSNPKPERMLIGYPTFFMNAASGGLKSALNMVGSNGITKSNTPGKITLVLNYIHFE